MFLFEMFQIPQMFLFEMFQNPQMFACRHYQLQDWIQEIRAYSIDGISPYFLS